MNKFTISENVKSGYDDFYDGESEWRRLSAVEKIDNIVNLCSAYPHDGILDIGAGEGSVLAGLANRGFGKELYALEVSDSAVSAIEERNIAPLIECSIFDGYNIPYDDKRFDLVILSHVLEHLEYPRRLIREAARVGRMIFVEVPLEDNRRLSMDYRPDKVGHINFYSPRTIRRLIQTCDLEVISQSFNNFSYGSYRHMFGSKALLRYLPKELLLKLAPALATRFWTYHCALVCRATD
jgi:SAM-dependent methyltransferase